MQEDVIGKLLVDENLSRRLVAFLGKHFPESIHAATANLLTSDDRTVWQYAKENGYCIITKDWDFKFLSAAYGCPPKVIHLNCGNRTTTFIADLLSRQVDTIREFLSDAEACYLEIE